MGDSSRTGIEPLFPAAAGIMALLIVMGALFAAPAEYALFLTGILFFGLGLLFTRRGPRFSRGAGLGILAPFLLTSAFLVTAFGLRYLLFPVLAAGGVASGVPLGRRGRPVAPGFMMALLWVAFVAVMTICVYPHLSGGIGSTGLTPKF